jgi:hypothetical protein
MRSSGDAVFDWVPLAVYCASVAAWLYSQSRRRQAFERLARDLGFVFDAGAKALHDLKPTSELAIVVRSSSLYNSVSGKTAAGESFLFDSRKGRGKGASYQTVAIFRSPNRRLPHFELRPTMLFYIVGKAGVKDIYFENAPEFSRKYMLRGEDDNAVRNLFTEDVLGLLMIEPGWYIQSDGEWLAIFQMRLAGSDKLREFFETTQAIASLFGGGASFQAPNPRYLNSR